MIEMSVEYTDAPATRPEASGGDKMPCPYCGHLLPKDAESCDRCDWTRSGATETAEGKASDAVAVILSVIPGLGHIQGTQAGRLFVDGWRHSRRNFRVSGRHRVRGIRDRSLFLLPHRGHAS